MARMAAMLARAPKGRIGDREIPIYITEKPYDDEGGEDRGMGTILYGYVAGDSGVRNGERITMPGGERYTFGDHVNTSAGGDDEGLLMFTLYKDGESPDDGDAS